MVVKVSTTFVHSLPVVLTIVATCMMVLEEARTLSPLEAPIVTNEVAVSTTINRASD